MNVDSLHVGIDENGLGPRLGPLVVTAAAARLEPGAHKLLSPLPRGKRMGKLLGDSKALSSFEDSSLGEAWARAFAVQQGLPSHSPTVLFDALLHAQPTLRAPCPAPHAAQCWNDADEKFVSEDSLVRDCQRALVTLAEKGFVIAGFVSTLVCTSVLNAGARRGLSRLQMDLHAMETLVLSLAETRGTTIEAVLGKVGGYGFYGDVFGPLGGRLHVALEETRARSSYSFPGLGTLSFVMDADASHTLVALASLVGKWVRDTFMRRILRHHERLTGEALPNASGYYDPVTAKFVARTALARKRVQFPDDCFERVRADLGQAPITVPKRASSPVP